MTERRMLSTKSGYAAYRKKVSMLIPWIPRK
jgi:protein-S-isoprenylcysteine O-methyltransferase Ste14